MLHRFITLDLARMSMSEQSLSFHGIGHGLLLVVMVSRSLFGAGNPARWVLRSLLRLSFLRQPVLPAMRIVSAPIGLQPGENPIQILRVLKSIAYEKCRVRICLHILLKIELVLQHIVDQTSQESDIGTDTNMSKDISLLRGTRKVWIDMHDRRSSLLCRHDPAKSHRMTLGHVTSLN